MAADKVKLPPPPEQLGKAGTRLWKDTLADLDHTWELTHRELRYLELAAGQLDHVVELEELIEQQGMVTVGSTGQPVLNAAVAEARNGRLAVHRLLGAIQLPVDEDSKGESVRSTRARHAAESRWRKEEDLRQRKAQARRARRGKA